MGESDALVLAVAKAIYSESYNSASESYEELDSWAQMESKEQAKAAIAAVRDFDRASQK